MDIDVARNLIKKYTDGHANFIMRAQTGERYYENETDILLAPTAAEKSEKDDDPLHNADNRIPNNFQGILVNQKTAYMFTAPPLFDVGNDSANTKISDALGDKYPKICKDLCVNASNTGVAWLHYWKADDGTLHYGVVDSKEVIPVYSNDLEDKLLAVLRVYLDTDDITGKQYYVYEIWSETECASFRRETDIELDKGLQEYEMFAMECDGVTEFSNTFEHGMEVVPFIPFCNNNLKTSDLATVKKHIDIYDKVYSGFANDLEDIQEIIFILSGYSGTSLSGFLNDLKQYKTVKLDQDADGNPGLQTLSIQIPVEAREKLLDITRKNIYEQGMGVDPHPDGGYGNASGEALKFMYASLELKAGLEETEFRLGFGMLVRAICKFYNLPCTKIIQTWTRTSIKNETEMATICAQANGIVSRHTILKNHPLVEDADAEEKQLKKEKAEAQKEAEDNQAKMFGGTFGQGSTDDDKKPDEKDSSDDKTNGDDQNGMRK